MAAISKCKGDNCDIKEQCRRFTEKSCDERWQSWIGPEYRKESDSCPNQLTVN
ncbi:MAG: hypothetical protein SCH71_17010 [Desulfobulbaceae bacterium]|nr:hypothetical protein [Desulfobulbaceae bacterium]